MSYRIGELDQRIRLERLVLTPDGRGGSTEEWVPVFCACALARPASGRESERFDRVNAEAMYRFVIHRREGILDSDRIVWRGIPYNIRMIHRRGTREMFLDIDAERGVAQ